LKSTEPFASTLLAADGARAPAQQSDRGSGARTVRLHLGVTSQPGVLSRGRPMRNQLVVRGEQCQIKGGQNHHPRKTTAGRTNSSRLTPCRLKSAANHPSYSNPNFASENFCPLTNQHPYQRAQAEPPLAAASVAKLGCYGFVYKNFAHTIQRPHENPRH